MKRPDSTSMYLGLSLAGVALSAVVGIYRGGQDGNVGELPSPSAPTARAHVLAPSVQPTPQGRDYTVEVRAGLASTPGASATGPVVPSASSTDIEPGQTVRVLTYEQWATLQAVFGADTYVMARTAFCESRLNPAASVVDTNGHVSEGAWQVQSVWHGDVPDTLHLQAIQAKRIHDQYGMQPWAATANGCREWNK